MDHERKNFYFPEVFHGTKAVSNESVQITDLDKIGYMHVYSNSSTIYIGASGVASDGLPINIGETYPITASNLSKWYVSGDGSISFAGNYAR